jgi:hypothetical protein
MQGGIWPPVPEEVSKISGQLKKKKAGAGEVLRDYRAFRTAWKYAVSL